MIANLFTKLPIPKTLPPSLQTHIPALKKLRSRKAVLEKAFTIITTRYHGEMYATITKFFNLFLHDARKIAGQPKVLHCTHQNYLLRVLLVKSGKFCEDDVQQKLLLFRGFSPHQYLRINLGEKWIDADPWAKTALNLPLGKHAA